MASAEEREQQRNELSKKRGRDDRSFRDGRHEKARQGSYGENLRGEKEQRLEDNNSYYGPREENGRRSPVASGSPTKVEDDEASAKEPEKTDAEKKPPIYKPNFGLSGALAKDAGNGGSRVYKGVVLKFQEPPEARAPNTQWRFYVFKGKDMIETLHIAKQSAYLCGRNKDICDIFMAHPSLSSQHAVLQYRALPNDQGRLSCQPYVIDLESTNGTFLNGVRIDAARYYQLKKGDVITFGASQREYVLLTENTTALR